MTHAIRWTVEKITQRLALIEPLVYRRSSPLPSFRYLPLSSPAVKPPVAPGLDDSGWVSIEPYTHWGKPFTDFVLRSTFQVPVDWDEGLPLALSLPLGDAANFSHPEALLYIDGEAFAACDRHHQITHLRPEWADGQSHSLALHGWTGLVDDWIADPVTRLVMRPCKVLQIDPPTRSFLAAARVALGTARVLDENHPGRLALLNALDAAFKLLDTREPFGEPFYASVTPAHAALKDGIARAGAALDVTLTATGHAHLDIAWLWTLDQSRRKAGRTFHNVLRLMEQFPEYHFTQSQPQLYEYVRQDYPPLFEAIKARVAEGRWEPIGGMWVEADCNLSGPESLARQFLLGRTFFRQHFGSQVESPVLWLPDVFGYSWALPQLIKQAGLEYFFTIKLGWNQYNRLPYDSFWWQGLDGTRVLTHFSSAPENASANIGTYNAPATPETVLGTWKNFQQKELQSDLLMAYGYGDGGGGPTREMLENLRELADFPGMPRTRQRSAGEFFRDLEQNSGPALPVWDGELYLEYHRGTYTTQSRNKRLNRKSEFLLHDAEFLACHAAQLDPGYSYPVEEFNQAWQVVCLNQFHDIIPGSSIGSVYVESQAQYAEIRQAITRIRGEALAVLANQIGGDWLLVNPTGFARRDLAWLAGLLPEGYRLVRQDGQPVLAQTASGGTWIDAGELAPFSLTPLFLEQRVSEENIPALTATPGLLENDFLRVELNPDGDIIRIFDKVSRREVLPSDALADQFQAFEDRPKSWDAWDIDIYYDDRMWLAEPAHSVRVVEAGALRATLEVERRILNSKYTQRISLTRHSARLDFDTTIDWCEQHILLKTAFPVDILSPVATYEIQWGNVQRPTHRNTSWDWARFETCAQKWVDLSEGGYGVSLLNDCKYGHDIQANVIRLSLLRGATIPDPEADQGEQRFAYSLLPHASGWEKGTVADAYALNDPLILVKTSATLLNQNGTSARADNLRHEAPPFVCCDSPNIVIETVKRAEDGQGVIVRLYESQRWRGPVTLSSSFPLAKVYLTNLLEENQTSLAPRGNQVTLFVRPYEIVTLRLIAAT
jgi:alpha-mannosidase